MKIPLLFKRKSKDGQPLSFSSERRGNTLFTNDFFRFLLVFTLIIIGGFAVIVFAQ